jgi:hypothetical protein
MFEYRFEGLLSKSLEDYREHMYLLSSTGKNRVSRLVRSLRKTVESSNNSRFQERSTLEGCFTGNSETGFPPQSSILK